jgi:peptidoglycan hydrolase-like protein with peptidoglycan-binding domain
MHVLATKHNQSVPSVFKKSRRHEHTRELSQSHQQPTVKNILYDLGAQAKLHIGQADDQYEREADRVAEHVMRMPEPRLSSSVSDSSLTNSTIPHSGTIQRICASCLEDKELIQTKTTGDITPEVTPAINSSIQSLQGGGRPMSGSERSFFEPRFGQDFSKVRVHADSKANQLAKSIHAKAFTKGNDVVFADGEYSPGSISGKRLLGHELTHVVQQQATSQKQGKMAISSFTSRPGIQRRIGDGHDLSSPRFSRDTKLQDIYDGTGTLKRGDDNESVRKIQHGIHDSGLLFLGHGVDGKFGRETRNRVIRFQRRHRITTDPRGEVGAATIQKLDQLYPAMALPTGATSAYTFPCMLQLLCQWNSAMIRDLRRLYVWMVADLEWADERFDGSSWRPNPMSGSGETVGHTLFIATDDTCENVARTLYHEYQHARSPVVYRRGGWGDEEKYTYRVETDWAIARGITPDPGLTTTNPATGQTVVNTSGISSTVASYPGLGTASPGEVIAKLSGNRVRVRLPTGRIDIRLAVAGDTVSGRRVTKSPRRRIRAREWRC